MPFACKRDANISVTKLITIPLARGLHATREGATSWSGPRNSTSSVCKRIDVWRVIEMYSILIIVTYRRLPSLRRETHTHTYVNIIYSLIAHVYISRSETRRRFTRARNLCGMARHCGIFRVIARVIAVIDNRVHNCNVSSVYRFT